MTPEFAYKKYVSLKLHFSTKNYDYFKYMGAVRVSYDAYENRRDKILFNKACKLYNKPEYLGLLISSFLESPNAWIGDILSDSGENKFIEWKRRIQSLRYRFSEDLDYIKNYIDDNSISFDELFKKENPYPKIVKMALQNQINVETFLIMNSVLNFIPKIDSFIDDTVLWDSYKTKCIKYSPFIIKNENSITKYKNIMRKKLL